MADDKCPKCKAVGYISVNTWHWLCGSMECGGEFIQSGHCNDLVKLQAANARNGKLTEALSDLVHQCEAYAKHDLEGAFDGLDFDQAKAALAVCASDSAECGSQKDLRVADGAQNPVIYNGMTLPELLKRFDEYEAASGKGDLVIKAAGEGE